MKNKIHNYFNTYLYQIFIQERQRIHSFSII